jgi:hypothetical protein
MNSGAPKSLQNTYALEFLFKKFAPAKFFLSRGYLFTYIICRYETLEFICLHKFQ